MQAILRDEIAAGSTVLDLGCGPGGVLSRAGLTGSTNITGVDLHEPSLEVAGRQGYRQIHRSDVITYLRSIPEGSFDVVTAFDLLEHLNRVDGLEFIDLMKRAAAKRVILLTPNGFVPQPASADNPFQEHLTGWTLEDMNRLGSDRIYGVNGYRKLRGVYAHPTVKPELLGRVLI